MSGFGSIPHGRSAFGGGAESTCVQDLATPEIINLSPANMSVLSRYDTISFDATDVGSGVQKILIWVDFEGEDRTFMVYDGSSFLYPFNSDSTIQVLDANTHRFLLKPTGGWVYNVNKLTVRVVDFKGNFDT